MRLEQVRGTFFQTRGGETLSANAGGSFMNHPKEFAEGLSIGIIMDGNGRWAKPVSYTHLRAHETDSYLVCRLLLEKKKK